MKLDWDYSELAESYHSRAPYCPIFITDAIKISELKAHAAVCDVGAGTGFLAREFAAKNMMVHAIEPNSEMQKHGKKSCVEWPAINWLKAHAEQIPLTDGSVDMVSFGSSFNVVNKHQALKESARVCKKNGWFLIVWNHRDIATGLQHQIESYIKRKIPAFDYGSRRDDQMSYLQSTGLFSEIHSLESHFMHEQRKDEVVTAWHSHATLKRQAGKNHQMMLEEISAMINEQAGPMIKTHFVTKGWLAKFAVF